MNESGKYEEPFAPASKTDAICICVCCGRVDRGTVEISQFPFRYIPLNWSYATDSRALRCGPCARYDEREPKFFDQNKVWIDSEEQRGSDGPRVKVYPKKATPIPRHTVTTSGLRTDWSDSDVSPANVDWAGTTDESPAEEVEVNKDESSEKNDGTRVDKLKEQGRQTLGAFGDGMQMSLLDAFSEGLLDLAKEVGPEVPLIQLAMTTPEGRELVKLVLSMMVDTLCHQTDVVPYSSETSRLCKKQMTLSIYKLTGPRMNDWRKHLTKLGRISAGKELVRARVEEDETSIEAELQRLREQVEESQSVREELAELRKRLGEKVA